MKSTVIIMAAAMAAGGMNMAPANAATAQNSLAPTTLPAPAKPDIKTTDAKIQHTIDRLTQDALTPNDMSRLVGLFAKGQQQRIAESSTYSEGYGAKLNTRIESISSSWKQKYGHDFAITKAHDVLSDKFASMRGEAPSGNNGAFESATVAIGGTEDAIKLDVPVVREKSDWKIDVPNTLAAERLRDNLLSELAAVDDATAHWPTNETDAYRMVARHVVRAVLDQPMPAHAQASAAPLMSQPAAQVKPVSATSTTGHHWWQVWDW